jgi:hypothetical protein
MYGAVFVRFGVVMLRLSLCCGLVRDAPSSGDTDFSHS